MLNQEYPEGLRPVAFASHKLSPSERNYPIHQLEFLALKWAVVNKFHDYLYGAQFTVRTDNNPLTYALTTARLNAVGHRWLIDLSTYNFSVQYKPGWENTDADLLSRHQRETEDGWVDIPPSGVKALCCLGNVSGTDKHTSRCVDQLGVSPEAIPDAYAYLTQIEISPLEQLSIKELIEAQSLDPVIKVVKEHIEEGRGVLSSKQANSDVSLMLRESSKLKIKRGLLYRVTKRSSGRDVSQLVLPARPMVFRALHDDITELIKDHFYWPRMASEIAMYVQNCGRCVARKSLPKIAAPLQQITSTGHLDLVCIDFLSTEPDSKGIPNVLVITDLYTRYAQAFSTKDQKALTVARVLVEKFFIHYGLPARIHSDQGRDFESKIIKELLTVLGIRKSRTSPYHLQGDPQPERFNRTLLSMLGTLDLSQKSKWSQHISLLVHAYNSTRNDATGYSPYFLMFGREARLPVDLCFGIGYDDVDGLKHHQYVADMREELRKAYQLAADSADKNHERNKRLYDMRVRNQILRKGDCVLVHNLGITGKHKLQDRLNSLPYVVLAKLHNLPVYRVKPERGTGSVKTVHRDHLLPIGYLVRMPAPSERKAQTSTPLTRAQKARMDNESQTQTSEHLNQEYLTSESEEEGGYYLPQLTLDTRPETQSQEFEPRDVMVSHNTAVSADASIHDLPEEDEVVQLPEAMEQMKEYSPSHRDSVADTEQEEGDAPEPSISAVRVDSSHDPRVREEVKPIQQLFHTISDFQSDSHTHTFSS